MAKPKPAPTPAPANAGPVQVVTPQAKAAQPASVPMTGVAFSIQASKDQGFANYRILTLFIVDGEIVHVERSQEFAAFEAIARTEMLVNSSLWNLSSRYKPAALQGLGGDARDELVNRLKKNNPELLERIAPALALKLEGDSK